MINVVLGIQCIRPKYILETIYYNTDDPVI